MRNLTFQKVLYRISVSMLLSSVIAIPYVKAEVSYAAELIASDHQIGNMLKWSTGFESNSQLFLIEKSEDGINFSEIGKIPGAGESEDINSYKFLDFNSNKDIAYYRLKHVTFDGTTSYSESIKTENRFTNQLMVMDININQDEFIVKLDSKINGELNYKVSNQKGKYIVDTKMEIIAGLNEILIDLSNEDIGVYKIEITMADEIEKMNIRKTERSKEKPANVALKKSSTGG